MRSGCRAATAGAASTRGTKLGISSFSSSSRWAPAEERASLAGAFAGRCQTGRGPGTRWGCARARTPVLSASSTRLAIAAPTASSRWASFHWASSWSARPLLDGRCPMRRGDGSGASTAGRAKGADGADGAEGAARKDAVHEERAVAEEAERVGRRRPYSAGDFFFCLKVRVKVDHIPAHFQASQAYRLIFISLPCGHFLFPARGYLDPQIW